MLLLTGLPERVRTVLAKLLRARARRAGSRAAVATWSRWAWHVDPLGAQALARLKREQAEETTLKEEHPNG